MKAKRARLRAGIGVINVKKSVECAMLNVDGYSDETLVDVQTTLASKKPDIVFLLETKRRFEEIGSDIDVDGYDLREVRRSDNAGDRKGGGIVVYTKNNEGLLFKDYDPDIDKPEHAFVKNERKWLVLETGDFKTAFCGVYLGFQADDDRHGLWNDSIYSVLRSEIMTLRVKGYRIVLNGDFNGHTGAVLGQGVVGNKPTINENGRRFLKFLQDAGCRHINGECRVKGEWGTRLTQGLWTRQRGGVSTIIDYGVISVEHLSSVKSLFIDDEGKHGGGSDHNWLFLTLDDKFVKQTYVSNQPSRKKRWDFDENFDWSNFQRTVEDMISSIDPGHVRGLSSSSEINKLAASAASILMESARKNIGYRVKKVKTSMLSRCLPADLLNEIEFKRCLETNWKSKLSIYSSKASNLRTAEAIAYVNEAERLFLEQKSKVSKLLFERRQRHKSTILEKCSQQSVKAIRCFWSHVTSKVKKSDDIRAVVSSVTGTLKCHPEDIKNEAELFLCKVFKGSFDPIPCDKPDDHTYSAPVHSSVEGTTQPCDHPYTASPSPTLPRSDGSGSIESDPQGWLEREFPVDEVKRAVSTLQNCKAVGLDQIPNEFIKNAGDKFLTLLTYLYNEIKVSGVFPVGWNAGRICLVHKRGLREQLGNYRPLTVIISLSGLYSRLLNGRLTSVVEQHRLLGEVQNGFRKERQGADNTFILDTILWKAKSKKKKVHLGFVDITKVCF